MIRTWEIFLSLIPKQYQEHEAIVKLTDYFTKYPPEGTWLTESDIDEALDYTQIPKHIFDKIKEALWGAMVLQFMEHYRYHGRVSPYVLCRRWFILGARRNTAEKAILDELDQLEISRNGALTLKELFPHLERLLPETFNTPIMVEQYWSDWQSASTNLLCMRFEHNGYKVDFNNDNRPGFEDFPKTKRVREEISARETKKSGCFVVTATYGSADAYEVMYLRNWRDTELTKTKFGRVLINMYYVIGPIFAAIIRQSAILRKGSRFLIKNVIKMLDKE